MDELQNLIAIERLCEEIQRQQRGNQSFIIYIGFIKATTMFFIIFKATCTVLVCLVLSDCV